MADLVAFGIARVIGEAGCMLSVRLTVRALLVVQLPLQPNLDRSLLDDSLQLSYIFFNPNLQPTKLEIKKLKVLFQGNEPWRRSTTF